MSRLRRSPLSATGDRISPAGGQERDQVLDFALRQDGLKGRHAFPSIQYLFPDLPRIAPLPHAAQVRSAVATHSGNAVATLASAGMEHMRATVASTGIRRVGERAIRTDKKGDGTAQKDAARA